jgi:phytoene dehydrogenase-like protein
VKRACVIGAGFGGLALAIRLQSAGIQTTVIEARDKPGGRAWYWDAMASRSMPGRPSSPIRRALRSCGTSAGIVWPTTWT